KPRNDPVVRVSQLRFGQLIDVDVHARSNDHPAAHLPELPRFPRGPRLLRISAPSAYGIIRLGARVFWSRATFRSVLSPRGGFGNLIAFPLQHGARQMGNTVFVDDRFVPHPDQWQFLAEHPCIDSATVDSIAHEASRKGLVVGVRLSDTTDADSAEPWT